jgi:hypothetical protein
MRRNPGKRDEEQGRPSRPKGGGDYTLTPSGSSRIPRIPVTPSLHGSVGYWCPTWSPSPWGTGR